jgi:hypothetical protein
MREHWLSPDDIQPLLEREGFNLEFLNAGADFTLVAKKQASVKRSKDSRTRGTNLTRQNGRSHQPAKKANS